MLQSIEKLKHTHVLLTGGCGFVGSNIAEFLLKNKVKKLRILDNLSTGKKENIQHLLDTYDNLEFLYGDLSNLETCRMAVVDMNVICHQGALGSVPRSIENPLNTHISNINGFLNILLSAKEVGIKRIVYASSSSVYGDHPVLPKVEINTGKVLSPYACTKAVNELYATVFSRCYDMECIGLRYFNIFGNRQDPNGAYAAVIPKFIKLMINGQQPTINGDGTYSRDFTHVDNAIQANVLAMTTTNVCCYGEAFNIGAGGQTTMLELIEEINNSLGEEKHIEPIFSDVRKGDIPHSNADITKAREMLYYKPTVNFSNGIKKLMNSELTNN
jgi:UDP-N-acetylglucosamine 4-epimerase